MKLPVFGNEVAMENEEGRVARDDHSLYNHVLNEAHPKEKKHR